MKSAYTSITYENNIGKCITFIALSVYIPWWLWFLYYNNICAVIINGVNQPKELLVFQMFGNADLKTFEAHVVSYISIRYI